MSMWVCGCVIWGNVFAYMRHAYSSIPSNACHFWSAFAHSFGQRERPRKKMHEKMCTGWMCQYFSVFLASVMPRKELKMQRPLLLQPNEKFAEGYCLLFLEKDKRHDFSVFFLLFLIRKKMNKGKYRLCSVGGRSSITIIKIYSGLSSNFPSLSSPFSTTPTSSLFSISPFLDRSFPPFPPSLLSWNPYSLLLSLLSTLPFPSISSSVLPFSSFLPFLNFFIAPYFRTTMISENLITD